MRWHVVTVVRTSDAKQTAAEMPDSRDNWTCFLRPIEEQEDDPTCRALGDRLEEEQEEDALDVALDVAFYGKTKGLDVDVDVGLDASLDVVFYGEIRGLGVGLDVVF